MQEVNTMPKRKRPLSKVRVEKSRQESEVPIPRGFELPLGLPDQTPLRVFLYVIVGFHSMHTQDRAEILAGPSAIIAPNMLDAIHRAKYSIPNEWRHKLNNCRILMHSMTTR